MHFPTVLGAVVPIYNVTGVSQPLTFTGPVLADIFLGKINKWNDPAIEKLNPGVTMPHADIAVAHRSDGSGTTYIWCDYLAKVSPEWKQKVGIATSVQWPTGIAAAAQRRRRRHRLADARRDRIRRAGVRAAEQDQLRRVQNMNGKVVKASVESVTAAAAAAATKMPADFRVSITNAPGDDVYPISSFTWMLLEKDPKDKVQSKVMVDFMKWALTDGQKFAPDLGYAPIPKNVVDMELKALTQIKVQ